MAKSLPLFETDLNINLNFQASSPGGDRLRLEAKYAHLIREELTLGKRVSYVGNKGTPLLALYRYKEAFALSFVDDFISRLGLTGEDYVFDPFCGMGTTLFAAALRGIPAIGVDKLPVPAFVAQTLPLFFSVEPGEIRATFENLRKRAGSASPATVAMDVAIMKIAFERQTLLALRKWKTTIDSLENPLRDIFLLLFFSILEPCSFTAKDGQFLRLVKDRRPADPEEALNAKVINAERDVRLIREMRWNRSIKPFTVHLGDTRDLSDVVFARQPTAIITSPPYVNRYDYTRTYALELCFHFVRNFEELKALRFGILRSHIESRIDPGEAASHEAVLEIVKYLNDRIQALNNRRIPIMLTTYFVDMEKSIKEWGRVLASGARVALVVDNVRYGGELLPVDLVLSELAEREGFETEEVIVARYKGNSSQQMGKYGRVPVRESIVKWRKR